MNLLKYILFFLPAVLMLGSCEKDAEPEAISIGMQLEEPQPYRANVCQVERERDESDTVKRDWFSLVEGG